MLPVILSQVLVYTPPNPVTQELSTVCAETLERNSKGVLVYNGVTYFLNGPQYASQGVLVGASSPTSVVTPNARQLATIKAKHARNECANL